MADLQLFSFNISDKNIEDVYLNIFKLPYEIEEAINELVEPKSKKNNIAGSTIFKIATAIFDEVIYANKTLKNIKKDDGIWFYSVGEFNLDILKIQVIEWLNEEYKQRKGTELNRIFKEIWSFDEKISLKEILNRNSGSKYSIIPNYYIYKLSKNTFEFESINRNLKFYRTIEENSTILMTLPIELEKRVYTPFSYFIECNMKDPIDIDGYVMNVYLKIRVWQDFNLINEKNENYIRSGDATSVFIYRENDYYSGEDILFNKIKIYRDNKNIYTTKDTCDNQYINLMGIDMIQILTNINQHMTEGNECIALIINKDKKRMKTQNGAGIPERNDMLNNIVKMLPELNLREPIKSIATRGQDKLSKITQELKDYYGLNEEMPKETKINKYEYKINKKIDKVVLHVYTENEKLIELATKLLPMYLKLEKSLITNGISKDGYEVEVICHKNDFTREFEENEDRNNRKEEIENLLPKYDKKVLNLAFIDIPPYHKHESTEKRDPKDLIRTVFKNNKILTQFINYNDDTNKSIVMNSIKDLIAATGFIDDFLYKGIGIEESDILIGINKISDSNNENILAMSKIEKGKIFINIYGIDKWMELDECIFSINKRSIKSISIGSLSRVAADGIDQWIKSNLSKELEKNNKVYTFVDISLRNQMWKYIQNKNFTDNLLNDLRMLNKEQLRLIRINNSDEVPEYYIYDEKTNNINKKSGIFKSDKNTYYLIGQRQDTDQTPNGSTKCSSPNKPLRKPSLYEVNIIGCKNEQEKDDIAVITQGLRMLNISYDKHASLPLPMYVIKRISEYIIAENNC